jgi:16S rRNA (guanine527-N7)-methyltransferase
MKSQPSLSRPQNTPRVEGVSALDRLRDAADTLGLQASDAQLSQLLLYLDLLGRWNSVYNLTAVRDPGEMLTQHLLDCLAIVPSLRRHSAEHPLGRLLDVGSGGGLPGVVLAVLDPQWEVSCVDAVGKKAAFVRQVASELGLRNLQSLHSRVEQSKGQYDLVTSRAFATLADFVRLTADRLAPGGAWLAMKGKLPTEEMAALPAGVEVFHVEQLRVPDLEAHRCIVWMRPR